MAAEVKPLQPVKLPAAPTPLTSEQRYWRSFGSRLLIPSPSNNPVTHISFPPPPSNPLTPPCDYFAVTSGPRVEIFSIRSRKLIKTINRFNGIAHGGEIRRDGRVLVAGDDTGAIQVFDVNSRAILKTWNEHKQPVWTTKFSPDELTTLMSTSDDQTVRLWDLPSEQSTTTFVGHRDYVRSGAFMPGQASRLLVSGSYDQTVKLWDPRTPAGAVITFKHAAAVEAVLPLPSGTTVLAAAENQVSVLDLVAGKPLHLLRNHQKTVTSLALAWNGTRVVAGGLDGHVKIFETTGWNVVAGSKYSSPILSLSVIASGSGRDDRHLAVGMQSGALSIKTRLSGQAKVQERERQKEMQALLTGTLEEHDKKTAKKRPGGWEKRLRGRDFRGDGVDLIIDGNDGKRRKKIPNWEKDLSKGRYAAALDQVLEGSQPIMALTLLTTLRHRSGLRNALQGRDEVTLQPIIKWVFKYINDPRYVKMCVDVGLLILDIYAAEMGRGAKVDNMMSQLHTRVVDIVEEAQIAWQTQGMLDMITIGG